MDATSCVGFMNDFTAERLAPGQVLWCVLPDRLVFALQATNLD